MSSSARLLKLVPRLVQPRGVSLRANSLPTTSLRGLSRGFTLIEMMVVVFIISMFAALAAPSVVRLSRDQRTLKQTLTVMNTYREAQARSLGSGAAVMVSYTPAGDTTISGGGPFWQVFESRDALGLPFAECSRTKWVAGAPGAGVYGTGNLLFSIGMGSLDGKGTSSVSTLAFTPSASGTPFSTADVCYSPKGKVFAKLNGATTWGNLTRLMFTTQRLEYNTGVGVGVGLPRAFIVSGLGTSRMVEPCQQLSDCTSPQICDAVLKVCQ